MPQLGLKWGYDPSAFRETARVAYYLQTELLTLLPYNGWALPQPLVSVGVSYRLNNERNVKHKEKIKNR